MISMMARRSYGTGSLFVRVDASGRESWYGQWRAGDALVKRKLGEKRRRGERTGMTKAQAEAELRRRIDSERPTSTTHERPSVGEVGRRYLDHLAGVGRKRSTLMDYESHLRVHLVPFFGSKPLNRIEPGDIESFIGAKRRQGRAPKSILNYLGLLHSIFEFGQRRRWITTNPCKQVDKPRAEPTDADVRFLDQGELEALLEAAPESDPGRVDRLMWLTAAMTGLRQGELLALRWRDIDWLAGRIRCARASCEASSGRRSRTARHAPYRSPTASPPSSTRTIVAPRTGLMTISSSGIRTSARRSSARGC